MSDQPIPQEVDPVRGLREALEPFAELCEPSFDDGPPPQTGTVHLMIMGDGELGDLPMSVFWRAATALSTYRAWEEGGGPAERAEGGVRGRLQAPPSEGTTSAPADGEPSFTLVFAGDLTKFSKNPLRTDTPFGRPYAAGIGNAFEELEALSSAALEAAGVDGAVTLSDPIPSLPASAPPEGWRPVSELKPEIGHVVVRHEVSYRWAPYKPDGQRQMKKPGRWQRATEYGWENADLPEGSLFIPASDHPRLSAAPPPPAGVDRPETEGEVVHPDMRGKIEAAIWEVVDRLKKRHGPLWFDMHTPGLMARAILALSQPVPARGEEGVG